MNLERNPTTVITYPRWLRGWCALTALATFGLIAIGTLVTTFHVGMADKLWPTAPWHLLLVERLPNFGWYVEHTHRIAGYLVGVFILVQTLALWMWSPAPLRRIGAVLAVAGVSVGTGWGMVLVKNAPQKSLEALANPGFYLAIASGFGFLGLAGWEIASRSAGRWHRLIVTVAYVGVVVQGLLGGLRVYLNELSGDELRVIHGIFAQVVFGGVCLLVMMAGRNWNSLTDLVTDSTLKKLSIVTLSVIFAQVAFGGLLRHLADPIGQRLHPLLAFVVTGLCVFMVARTAQNIEGAGALRRKGISLLATIGVQLLLGVEAWLRTADPASRYQPVGVADATIRSFHVLVGFGVVSTAMLFAARAWKAKLI